MSYSSNKDIFCCTFAKIFPYHNAVSATYCLPKPVSAIFCVFAAASLYDFLTYQATRQV